MKKKLLFILVLVGFAVIYACKDDSFPVPPATTEPKFSVILDNNGFAPATATFTNETVIPSTVDTVTYYWNFGDSTLSQEKNPTHFYERPGVFNVSLVVISKATNEINQFVQTLIVIDPNGHGTSAFFTDGGTVYSGYLNEQAPVFVPLFGGLGDSYGLVVDTVDNKIYVSDETGGKIIRSDIDGSNKVDWRTGMGVYVDGLAIDHKNRMLYFETTDGIRRTSLDDDGVDHFEEVVIGQGALDPEGIAIDSVNGKLYWNTYVSPGGVWMKDLGAGPGGETQIIPGSATPESGGGGSIIVVGNKIYYDDYDLGTDTQILRSANLDGSGVATVATDITRVVFALAYHPASSKVFWGDRDLGKIMRADPDGSNPDPWNTQPGSSPRGLFFGRTKQ